MIRDLLRIFSLKRHYFFQRGTISVLARLDSHSKFSRWFRKHLRYLIILFNDSDVRTFLFEWFWASSRYLVNLIMVFVGIYLKSRASPPLTYLRDALQRARSHNRLWIIHDPPSLLNRVLKLMIVRWLKFLHNFLDRIFWNQRDLNLLRTVIIVSPPWHKYLICVYVNDLLGTVLYVYYLRLGASILAFLTHKLLESRPNSGHLFSGAHLRRTSFGDLHGKFGSMNHLNLRVAPIVVCTGR